MNKINNKIVYSIIPARSGSKGIKNKNIIKIKGKELIYYSIETSINSKLINKTFVSTDSSKIQKLALNYGAECPKLRPKKISKDLSLDIEFCKQFLTDLDKMKIRLPDIVIILRPTTIFRKSKIIDKMIIEFTSKYKSYDSLRVVRKSRENPFKTWFVRNERLSPIISNLKNENFNKPRQILEDTYYQYGYADIIKTSTILNKNSISGSKILPYIYNNYEVKDIDEMKDLKN